MRANHFRGKPAASLPSLQRGVVLFIALIVMVVMSLAALGLIRSVDTTTAVLNNLAVRQAAILPANYAIEQAGVALFASQGGPLIPDIKNDWLPNNYYAEHNNWDSQNVPGLPDGVPQPLQTKLAAQGLPVAWTDVDKNRITYLIERMCNPAAPNVAPLNAASGTWCDMGQPKQSPGTTVGQQGITLPQQAFYRVTVRVDGPQNTVSFLQAMLR
jgi:type IV pilus assembly protein PilX